MRADDDLGQLTYIQQAIRHIDECRWEGKEQFLADWRTRSAVIHELHTLAESTQLLSDELKNNHPEIPWKDIAKFRNIAVHVYRLTNYELVWEVVESHLPALKACVDAEVPQAIKARAESMVDVAHAGQGLTSEGRGRLVLDQASKIQQEIDQGGQFTTNDLLIYRRAERIIAEQYVGAMLTDKDRASLVDQEAERLWDAAIGRGHAVEDEVAESRERARRQIEERVQSAKRSQENDRK